jgi:hypothetical protein
MNRVIELGSLVYALLQSLSVRSSTTGAIIRIVNNPRNMRFEMLVLLAPSTTAFCTFEEYSPMMSAFGMVTPITMALRCDVTIAFSTL